MYGVKVHGVDAPSKKAIREALRDDPADVYFYGTSAFMTEPPVRGDALPESPITFVGPNPYGNRRYYGQAYSRAGRLSIK